MNEKSTSPIKFGPDFYREKYGSPRYDGLVMTLLFGYCFYFLSGFEASMGAMILYTFIVFPVVENQQRRS